VTAFAAAKPLSTSTPLLRRELDPSEALTTRPWVLSGPTFQRARPEALSTGWLRVTLAPRAAMAPRKPSVSRLELPGLIVVLSGSCVPGRGTRHREPPGEGNACRGRSRSPGRADRGSAESRVRSDRTDVTSVRLGRAGE
jgi:hypothetical protein